MTSIDWDRFDAQRLDYDSSGDRTLDDPILAYLADHDCTEAEFYDRLRTALATLPDPPFWVRVEFFLGDCWWYMRRLFKP